MGLPNSTNGEAGGERVRPVGPPRTFFFCVFLVAVTALVMAKQVHVGYRAYGHIPNEAPLQGEWRKWHVPTEAEWVVRNIESAHGKDPHYLEEVEEYADTERWTTRLAGRPLTSEEWQQMREEIDSKRRFNAYWYFCAGWGASLLLLVPLSFVWSLVLSVFAAIKKDTPWRFRTGAWAMAAVSLGIVVLHRHMNIPYIF